MSVDEAFRKLSQGPISGPVCPIAPPSVTSAAASASAGRVESKLADRQQSAPATPAAPVFSPTADTVKKPSPAETSAAPTSASTLQAVQVEEIRTVSRFPAEVTRLADMQSDEFRALRGRIQATDLTSGSLQVTSCERQAGASEVALHLALSLARVPDRRVLLIDLDLRLGDLRRRLAVDFDGHDIVAAARGVAQPHEAIVLSEQERLYVAGVQEHGAGGLELLDISRLRELLDRLAKSFDWVILHAAPALEGADATILGAIVGGTLLVIRSGQTTRGRALRALDELRDAGARVLGVVLTDAPEPGEDR